MSQQPSETRERVSFALSMAGRILNGGCWAVTGVVLLILFSRDATWSLWYVALIGVAMTLYGLRILLTRGSYWITSLIYVGPFIALFLLFR